MLTCFLSASILKAPNWQVTIHLLIFFGSNQSVLLFSSLANTTGYMLHFQPCLGSLWWKSLEEEFQAWVYSWCFSLHIILVFWRWGSGTCSCLILSWFLQDCQGLRIKSDQVGLGNLITLGDCGEFWQWAESRNSNPSWEVLRGNRTFTWSLKKKAFNITLLHRQICCSFQYSWCTENFHHL